MADTLSDYLRTYSRLIAQEDVQHRLISLTERIIRMRDGRGKILLAGNGASASIASHLATDFSKQARVRAMAFNDANLITALGNDCGYENWISKAVELYADDHDLLILVSSSGRSPNVFNAARSARARGLYTVAFTGFAAENPLGREADENFWVDSSAYNIVECVHMIWLTALCDLVIGTVENAVSEPSRQQTA